VPVLLLYDLCDTNAWVKYNFHSFFFIVFHIAKLNTIKNGLSVSFVSLKL